MWGSGHLNSKQAPSIPVLRRPMAVWRRAAPPGELGRTTNPGSVVTRLGCGRNSRLSDPRGLILKNPNLYDDLASRRRIPVFGSRCQGRDAYVSARCNLSGWSGFKGARLVDFVDS